MRLGARLIGIVELLIAAGLSLHAYLRSVLAMGRSTRCSSCRLAIPPIRTACLRAPRFT